MAISSTWDARCFGESTQVTRVRGKNIVSVRGQADDGRVDRIRSAADRKQHARPPTENIIDRHTCLVPRGMLVAAGAVSMEVDVMPGVAWV